MMPMMMPQTPYSGGHNGMMVSPYGMSQQFCSMGQQMAAPTATSVTTSSSTPATVASPATVDPAQIASPATVAPVNAASQASTLSATQTLASLASGSMPPGMVTQFSNPPMTTNAPAMSMQPQQQYQHQLHQQQHQQQQQQQLQNRTHMMMPALGNNMFLANAASIPGLSNSPGSTSQSTMVQNGMFFPSNMQSSNSSNSSQVQSNSQADSSKGYLAHCA